tara:strand:- start:148 stop:768 length:621 start_codon:yes stop_codon:yes gene_type:complete
MNEKDLRQLIEEQYRKLTLEQESEEVPTGDEPDAASPTSVDAQIDELLLQYEKLSIPNAGDDLLEALKNSSLRFILEQEEVNVDVNVEEEGEGEEDAEEAAEEEEAEADVESEKKLPELDIATFALKVARLAEIPEKVLDLKDAIINRAIQYLETNYDDNVAKEFETALMDKFQLAVPEEEVEKLVASDLPAPPAVGAGPGGGAGG